MPTNINGDLSCAQVSYTCGSLLLNFLRGFIDDEIVPPQFKPSSYTLYTKVVHFVLKQPYKSKQAEIVFLPQVEL